MDLNKVTMIGRVVRDPNQRASALGKTVVEFSLATHSAWRDEETKTRCDAVDFHDVLAVGRLGEIVKQYVTKATKVYVEGPLRNQPRKHSDGTTYFTRVIQLERLILLAGRSGTKTVPEEVTLPLREEPEMEESDAADGEGAVR
ncbi:MAG: single-stranded DNA-binding protein [Candidatus Eisenbacteria bacterium]